MLGHFSVREIEDLLECNVLLLHSFYACIVFIWWTFPVLALPVKRRKTYASSAEAEGRRREGLLGRRNIHIRISCA